MGTPALAQNAGQDRPSAVLSGIATSVLAVLNAVGSPRHVRQMRCLRQTSMRAKTCRGSRAQRRCSARARGLAGCRPLRKRTSLRWHTAR